MTSRKIAMPACRHKISIALVTLLAGAFASSALATTKSWQSKMSELATALSDAIPYLYPAPGQDAKELNAQINRIYEITKQLDSRLDHSIQVPDSDPAVPYVAHLLRADIERAYESVQEGDADYAKRVVRSSVAYCIACHTRSEGGAQFPLLAAFSEPLKRASWIERIEFQAASRQYDAVSTQVMLQLESPGTIGIRPLDLDNASLIALSIAVRVKQDPDSATLLAKAVGNSPSSTVSMREGAKVWLTDIGAWRETRERKFESDKDLIEFARQLIKSDSPDGILPGDHAEVRLLRASAAMHDLLKRFPQSEYTPEALYIVGSTYDSLRGLGLWNLHEMYFLACIEKAPHSLLAEQCYKRYESSVTLSYTGSRGTNIPKAIRDHLEKMHQLAKTTKQQRT